MVIIMRRMQFAPNFYTVKIILAVRFGPLKKWG